MPWVHMCAHVMTNLDDEDVGRSLADQCGARAAELHRVCEAAGDERVTLIVEGHRVGRGDRAARAPPERLCHEAGARVDRRHEGVRAARAGEREAAKVCNAGEETHHVEQAVELAQRDARRGVIRWAAHAEHACHVTGGRVDGSDEDICTSSARRIRLVLGARAAPGLTVVPREKLGTWPKLGDALESSCHPRNTARRAVHDRGDRCVASGAASGVAHARRPRGHELRRRIGCARQQRQDESATHFRRSVKCESVTPLELRANYLYDHGNNSTSKMRFSAEQRRL